jgi:hypothetical protein
MATRRLLNVDVSFISLVSKGANKKTLIWKSADNNAPTLTKSLNIKKIDEDQHKVYCIVYSPDETDSQGDTATKEVIEKMAYGFMKAKNIENVDQQHDFKADEGYVAESWILKTSDPVFPLDKEGSWAVCIKVDNEDTWDKIKKGEITGLSMAGIAEVEEVADDSTTVEKSIVTKSTGLKMKIAEIKKFVVELFKSKTVNVQKDLNTEVQAREVNSLIYALERVVYDIYDNGDIDDKKAAVLESIDQLKTAVALVKFEPIEKAGKAISAKNMEKIGKIKECYKSMGEHLSALSPDEEDPEDGNKEPVQKNDNSNNSNKPSEGEEMKPEEVQKMINTAVEKAVEPIKKENDALKTEVETPQD